MQMTPDNNFYDYSEILGMDDCLIRGSRLNNEIKKRIADILSDGLAERVYAWEKGEFAFERRPRSFSLSQTDGMVCDGFCGANLCKRMIELSRESGKTVVLLKPCDSRGFELLRREHRIKRENVYAVGIPCAGIIEPDKLLKLVGGFKNVVSICFDEEKTLTINTNGDTLTFPKTDVLSDRCLVCRDKAHVGCDEVFMPEANADTAVSDRFEDVKKIEALPARERFDFWQNELSRCVRCNACRNVCPACSCVKCVFDNESSTVASKANADSFEEKLYHVIRAYHVCGRCVDCGECSRVCPEKIPLHLLNRKFIKDASELYGDSEKPVLLTYGKDDPEPSVIYERGENSGSV